MQYKHENKFLIIILRTITNRQNFTMQSIRMDTDKIIERSAWKIRNYLWINKDSVCPKVKYTR